MRGLRLRAGYVRWVDLHRPPLMEPLTDEVGEELTDEAGEVLVGRVDGLDGDDPIGGLERKPLISGFEYVSGGAERIFVANATTLFDVTSRTVTIVADGQKSGNWSSAQFSNAAGDWIIAVNDAGDPPLRSIDGMVWEAVVPPPPLPDPPPDPLPEPPDPPAITGPPDTPVENGEGLTYVWKYRNRLFFIQGGSMNAWYLGINSIGGALLQIPLAGSTRLGGDLLFGAVLSVDAGDGMDDKIVFVTTLGEALVFTGSNPGDPANWRQEGRFTVGEPLGQNAHTNIGGDLMVLTVEGIVPLSQAIQKAGGTLEQAMLTRNIKPLWRDEVTEKRRYPWTIKKWDEAGAVFVAMPGGKVNDRSCLVANNATGAWARFAPNYDAQFFLKMSDNWFFGTQDGVVMLAERTGYDDGLPYTATLVGGWEMFQQPSAHVVWHQARAVFKAPMGQPFVPQLSATTDFQITMPPPPPAGVDSSTLLEVWDQGNWDLARWDQAEPLKAPIRNTMWVSIGQTGFTHAPVVQVTVGQRLKPEVELIAIAATYERAGVNV